MFVGLEQAVKKYLGRNKNNQKLFFWEKNGIFCSDTLKG